MNCPTENTLRAYVDAELNPLEISELKSHLQSCAGCQARYQTSRPLRLCVSPRNSLRWTRRRRLSRRIHNWPLRDFRPAFPADEPPIPFFARLFSGRSRFAWAASLAAAILPSPYYSPPRAASRSGFWPLFVWSGCKPSASISLP